MLFRSHVKQLNDAKLRPTIEKIELSPSDTRVAWGKKAVEKVGGTEYMKTATNPAELAGLLGQLKSIAAHYKT